MRFKRAGDRVLLIGPDGTVLDSRPIHQPAYPTFKIGEKRRTKNHNPSRRRARLMERQGGLCFYCSGEIEEGADDPSRFATIDEVTPRCEGGLPTYNNQVAACYACNTSKGRRMPTEEELRRLAALPAIKSSADPAVQAIIDDIDDMEE